MARVVCFGELLLRLSAPGREKLLQSPRMEVRIGGAEANVGVSLSCFGHQGAAVDTVADNALGEAALGELRRYGLDTTGVRRVPGRMGLYFLAPGAIHRPAEVLYDRAGSAFALAPADAYDWPALLAGADLDEFDIDDVLLGVGAGAAEDLGRVVHRVPDAELAHVGADLLDDAGDVVPGDRRERHQIRVVSATDLIVEWVDRGRMDAHPYLARLDPRYGHVAQLEGVRSAETFEHKSFHRFGHSVDPPRGSGFVTPCDGTFFPARRPHTPSRA